MKKQNISRNNVRKAKIHRGPRMVELVRAVQSNRLTMTRRQVKFQQLASMLGRREEVLQRSYGCNINALKIANSAVSYNHSPSVFLDLPNFLKLSKAPLKAVLSLGQTEERLYDAVGDILIDVHISTNRFILCNTRTAKWIVQSWGRPQDAGVAYHDFGVKGYPDKSKFHKEISRWAVAMAAFNDPVGVIRSESQIWLYSKFKKTIGTLPGSGKSTAWARVQCDRVNRNKGTGYRTRIHGYPVSEVEVEADLAKCKSLFQKLNRNPK